MEDFLDEAENWDTDFGALSTTPVDQGALNDGTARLYELRVDLEAVLPHFSRQGMQGVLQQSMARLEEWSTNNSDQGAFVYHYAWSFLNEALESGMKSRSFSKLDAHSAEAALHDFEAAWIKGEQMYGPGAHEGGMFGVNYNHTNLVVKVMRTDHSVAQGSTWDDTDGAAIHPDFFISNLESQTNCVYQAQTDVREVRAA